MTLYECVVRSRFNSQWTTRRVVVNQIAEVIPHLTKNDLDLEIKSINYYAKCEVVNA